MRRGKEDQNRARGEKRSKGRKLIKNLRFKHRIKGRRGE